MTGRFDRHLPLFGEVGQQRISTASVAIVGVGGLGSHIVQQLALLGIKQMAVIDAEELADTNRNRYVTARLDDPVPGTRKVDIAARLAHAIDPAIQVGTIQDSVVSTAAFDALIAADYVFGCLDSEGARLILNELCAAYTRPYLDLASDVIPGEPPEYGGRVAVVRWQGDGCLVCRGLLDMQEANLEIQSPEARRDRDALYGVNKEVLGRSGPSVVSINGVVASLAVTEFMALVTGLREPKNLLTYRGHLGRLTTSLDRPEDDCYYCQGVRGQRDAADVQRYILAGVGAFLR